ncbi:MAG: winged helix-turn-helix transcriptional regulator [Promethearchaeota archaeon]|nr:MAG: winged helix-turn-helix transcriptional regulator [Candidatus Lokiarchaeota archaeon]
MSQEKKRDTKDKEEKNDSLEESSFRRNDFTPLVKIDKKESAKSPAEVSHKKSILDEELTEIENDVLEIAKDILKLKRYDAEFEVESEAHIQKYPIIEKLYAKCIAKLSFKKGYSKADIFLAIRSLEEKNWIVTNERRTKLEILENEKLMKIYDFIGKNSGIHARDEKIEKELNLTRTPFLKHIMTLERFNLIRSKKIGKSLHYFLSEIPEDDKLDKLKVMFLNPLIPKILEEISKDNTISISKIGDNIDYYSGTVQYHVKKLKKLDLLKISKDKEGRKTHIINKSIIKKYKNIYKEPDFSKILLLCISLIFGLFNMRFFLSIII